MSTKLVIYSFTTHILKSRNVLHIISFVYSLYLDFDIVNI